MIFFEGSGDIDRYWFFSSQAFSHLHEVFKEADKEGRGWISEEEFVRVDALLSGVSRSPC